MLEEMFSTMDSGIVWKLPRTKLNCKSCLEGTFEDIFICQISEKKQYDSKDQE